MVESKRKLRRERSIERIVNAAVEVFSERGFFKPPVDLIAERAGVSKALVFWYFGSKDDLVLEVARRSLPVDVVDRCISSGLRGEELLRCIGLGYLEKYEDEKMRRLFLHAISASALYPQIGEGMRCLCTSKLEELARLVFGEVSREAEVRLRAFMGALLCHVIHKLELDKREYVDVLIRVTLGNF